MNYCVEDQQVGHAQAERLRAGIAGLEQSTKGFLQEWRRMIRLALMTRTMLMMLKLCRVEMKTLGKRAQTLAAEEKRWRSCRRETEQGCVFQLLPPVLMCFHYNTKKTHKPANKKVFKDVIHI